MNYSYFSNFLYINKYSRNFNNNYLDSFIKFSTFKDKSEVLLEYFDLEENSTKKNSEMEVYRYNYLKRLNFDNIDNIAKIADNYFFKYSFNDKEIVVLKYNNKENTLYEIEKTKTTFTNKIKNITIFNNLNNTYTIYICLSENKKIVIFNFHINSETLIKSKDEINKSETGYFNKAIQLSNEIVAATNNLFLIDIWIKDKKNETGYSYLTRILTKESSITDILSINSDYFITSHIYGKLSFYDIKSLSLIKIINKIDCLSTSNTLLKFGDLYIIVNCVKGFTIISIKTKEVVQFIQDYYDSYNKKEFFLNSNNNIYIMYVGKIDFINDSDSDVNVSYERILSVFVLKFMDTSFQPLEKYEKIKVNDELHLICVNDQKFMLSGKNVYLIDE